MKTTTLLCIIWLVPLTPLSGAPPSRAVTAEVDFGDRLRDWDGFGVNYVEVRHTRNYDAWPQDYGGFSYLSDTQRWEILDHIFGDDGLRPALAKMFLCPYHETAQDNADPYAINPAGFDHARYTRWMRWFIQEGLSRTRARGDNLTILAGLYAAPAWAIQQGAWGRDLRPDRKKELAEYMIAWVRYLIDVERLPVRYLSLHNGGGTPLRLSRRRIRALA